MRRNVGGGDIDFHVSHTTKWSNSDVFYRLNSEAYRVNGIAVMFYRTLCEIYFQQTY